VSVLHGINGVQNAVVLTLIQRKNVNSRMCVHNCMSAALCPCNRPATVDLMQRQTRSYNVNSDAIMLQRHAHDEASCILREKPFV